MAICKSLLPEFEINIGVTKKTLECVPDDSIDWKAHEKSDTIGEVACNLDEFPGWVEATLTEDLWDINALK